MAAMQKYSEASIEFKEPTKPRATKKCEICDIIMLSSSHARHVKSKSHLKSILLTHFLSCQFDY